MHPLLRLPWAAAGLAADLAAALLPASDAKWARTIRARRGAADRWRAFAPHRDPTRPLAWLHAPSVGEGLQALPVVQRLQKGAQPPQIAVSWYSASAAAFAPRFAADFGDYLLFDTTAHAKTAIDALRPSALVFAKLDVWPILTETAARRGVPLGMIAATVRRGSGRSRPIPKALLRDAYAALDLVGAIASDDAERLVALGVRPSAVRVTGDSRYDQAWERAHRPPGAAPWRQALADGRPTLVAGSTWPSDERVLLEAWSALRRRVPDARLVIAPHEPSPTHLAPIRAWATAEGVDVATLDAPNLADAAVVLIDRVGVLGDLYGIATAAFVGGGFHHAGLHSVLEPAAFGVPVLFGPQHEQSRDALRLIDGHGAQGVTTAGDLSARLGQWLGNPAAAASSGTAARAIVQAELGAAERSTALVRSLLGHA